MSREMGNERKEIGVMMNEKNIIEIDPDSCYHVMPKTGERICVMERCAMIGLQLHPKGRERVAKEERV